MTTTMRDDQAAQVMADRIRMVIGSVAGVKDVADEAPLREVGLTSLDLVKVVLGIEEEFELELSDHDISPQNFASVRTIADFLMAQAEPRAAEAPLSR